MIRNILLVVFTFASSVSFHLKATSPRDRMAHLVFEMMEENANFQRYAGSEEFAKDNASAEESGRRVRELTELRTKLEAGISSSNQHLESVLPLIENPEITIQDIFIQCMNYRNRIINSRNANIYDFMYRGSLTQDINLISSHSEPSRYFYSGSDIYNTLSEYDLSMFQQLDQLLFLTWSQMSHEERLDDNIQKIVKTMPSLWETLYGEKPWNAEMRPDNFCGFKLFNIAYQPLKKLCKDLMTTIKEKHHSKESNDVESDDLTTVVRENIEVVVADLEAHLKDPRYSFTGVFQSKTDNTEKIRISLSVQDWIESVKAIDCLEDLAGGRFYYDRLSKTMNVDWKATIAKYKQTIEKKKREEEAASKPSKPKHKGKKGKGNKKRSGHKNRSQPNPEHFSTHFSMEQVTEGVAAGMPEEENDEKLLEAVMEVLDMDEEGEEKFEEAAAAGGEGHEEEADEAVEDRQEKEFVYPDMVRKWASSTIVLAQPRKELAETSSQFQRFLIDLFDPTKVSQITFKKFHKNWAAIGGKIAGFKNGGSHRLIQFPKALMNQQKDAAASSTSHMQTGNVSLWGTFDHKKRGFSYTADNIGPLRSAFVWAGYYPEGIMVK
jgi:hypothetical protein